MKQPFLTLFLTLALGVLACAVPVGSPVSVETPVLTRTPNAAPRATATAVRSYPNALGVATISQAVVNIRAKPNGAVIGSVQAGDQVTVVDCGTDPKQPDYNWCRISKPVAGFVYRGCITELSDELKCQAKS